MREYLKNLRKSKKITQEQAGQLLNISGNYYGAIENGERMKNMNINMAEKISSAFEVPVEYIISEEKQFNGNTA